MKFASKANYTPKSHLTLNISVQIALYDFILAIYYIFSAMYSVGRKKNLFKKTMLDVLILQILRGLTYKKIQKMGLWYNHLLNKKMAL